MPADLSIDVLTWLEGSKVPIVVRVPLGAAGWSTPVGELPDALERSAAIPSGHAGCITHVGLPTSDEKAVGYYLGCGGGAPAGDFLTAHVLLTGSVAVYTKGLPESLGAVNGHATATGSTVKIDGMRTCDTVASLKGRIAAAGGPSVERQRPVFNGQLLTDDEAPLADYGLSFRNEWTVQMRLLEPRETDWGSGQISYQQADGGALPAVLLL